MNDFIFYNPVKVYFGKNHVRESLADTVKQYGHRVLLVYGGNSIKRIGLYDTITDLLSRFELYELNGIESNPDVESVRKGQKICSEHDIDVILAIGGGSVIDAAKWISASACVDFDPWDFFSRKTTIDNALPIITILTIAATGSEMNCGGVISNRELCKKIGRSSPNIYPKVSFLNPEYTFSVNKYQTACGIVDILSHIMEVYFNRQESLQMLNGIMESMMKTTIKYGVIAFDYPDNYEARANMMWTASWAINGFINGPVRQAWNCHTIEHELSARYGMKHGHGLAILLPRWIQYCYDDGTKEVYKRFADEVLDINYSDDVAREISDYLSGLFYNKLGLKSGLKDMGIPYDDLKDIASSLCSSGPVTGFADLEEKDVFEILSMCY